MSEERSNGGPVSAEDIDLDTEFEEPDTGEELDADDGEREEEPLAEEEPPQERQPAQRPRQPGRRERQAREIRELRERLERNERELANARQIQQQPQRIDPVEQARRDQVEREQVSLLSPDQQIAYWRQKDRQEIGAVLTQQTQHLADQVDRNAWEARCERDPVRRRLSAQVEAAIAAMPPSAVRNRETVFKYLYGEQALAARDRQTGRQRQAANRRVQRQTTEPGNGRSDAPRDRGNESQDNSLQALRRRVYGSGRPLW